MPGSITHCPRLQAGKPARKPAFKAFSSEVVPVRVKKMRQIKNIGARSDSIGTGL